MAHLQLPEMPAAPVLELHGQRKVIHIPQGLKLMLEDCTREVLRNQPQPANLYKFLAGMLEDKLIIREFKDKVIRSQGGSEGRKSWQWRRWSWDGSSLLSEEELIKFLSEFNISLETAQRLALIIQSTYRGFIVRKKLRHDHDVHRQELWDEWRLPGNMYVSDRDVLEILAYYKVSLFEANAFATKIQKVFRGHAYRKMLEETQPDLSAYLHSLGITRKTADEHAAKIQSAFRGFAARRKHKGSASLHVEVAIEEVAEAIMEEEEEVSESEQGEMEMDASEELEGQDDEASPKYEAFFPEGINELAEAEIEEGNVLPPPFTHEHFGEIDPSALRTKFSTPDFKVRMSQLFKGLEEATEDQRVANLHKVESVRKPKEALRKSKSNSVAATEVAPPDGTGVNQPTSDSAADQA